MALPLQTASAAPQVFSGVGTAQATGGLDAFRTAIGGVNNGGAPPPATGGRREINWDGVPVDGSTPGSVIIAPGQTVGIPTDLFQPRGVTFDRLTGVSIDGFTGVNPGVAGQFPAFSPTRTFAPFNTNNQVVVSFVLASARGTAAVPAGTRGFGAIFLDVETPNTSSIEYFAGATSLGRFFVPPGPTSQPEFLGVLFDAPVVTSVRITTGTAVLFSFSGGVVTSGPPDLTVNPALNVDQVALDDFIYAEPTTSVVPTPVVPTGPTPVTSGQANAPCAGAVGQTCNITGGANGTWTKRGSGSFTVTALGPAGTAPGSTPRVFLPTTSGVETFACTPVGVAAPFVANCTGSTVGDLLQGATVTVRFALFAGGIQDVTGTVTGPGPSSITLQQAFGLVQTSGQPGVPCAIIVGKTCQATVAVRGTGTVTNSMTWNLTATVPAGVAVGVVPVAVFATTAGLQGFACAAVAAAGGTVVCNGTTTGNALQGSNVTVLFAAGLTAVGTINGNNAAANVGALLPPPPIFLPPPPPPPIIPVPSGGQGMMGGQSTMGGQGTMGGQMGGQGMMGGQMGGQGMMGGQMGGQGMMGGQMMPQMPAPTATPAPANGNGMSRTNGASQATSASQPSSAPPSTSASQSSSTSEAMPAGAPPARPVMAESPAPLTSAEMPLVPAPMPMSTTTSPLPADPTSVEPASQMPWAPESAAAATSPEAASDDTLQDLAVEP